MQGMDFERILGGVCAPEGFLASAVSCGIKGKGEFDLALLYSETPAVAVGAFTRNELKAAPVVYSQKCIESKTARAVVVNSGNANSMTGSRGLGDAEAMAATVEKALDLSSGTVLVASTGPIGEYLPMEKVTRGIEQAVVELSPGGNTDAAIGIMTTDTYPKELAVEIEIAGKVVRMGAMAKGSGMIHPDLGTMIVVITADVEIDADMMQEWLNKAVEWSFNRISVDGDQSTNDTVIMLANGAAFPEGHDLNSEEGELFFKALCWLTANLAMALVKDGEGATKLLRIVVNGARDDSEAVLVARSIANSNLVKCAFYGGVPNWGRIASAVGSAGVALDPDKIDIFLGENKVASGGGSVGADYKNLVELLKRDEVEITLELGLGSGSAYFLTTDLSSEYVKMNASEKT
ncbi:MAG: bifunctional glutamate N-acetyltransferase/amino-acid acetyltransferase ArgJ [Actinobacteria bacterium]|nr:bifunctional glutamate N-acetyltransferase/amino-acid acetyltransferase ArgJ [Actinomycetota bacterium]